MLNSRIVAVLVGCALLAPLPSIAQDVRAVNIAHATAEVPRNYVVFFESGSNRLPNAAADIVRNAAISASLGTTVRIVGRADRAEAVKRELVRDGVPAGSIVIVPAADKPLPTARDGLGDPSSRKVEIKL